MRIHKWLSQKGICSLRKAEELIAQGKVLVNGKKAIIGQNIDEHKDEVEVHGKKVGRSSIVLKYYMLYKPTGVLCSAIREGEKPCLYDLDSIKRLRLKLNYAGRLDFFSEGLLLMTNDGQFCNRMLHPRYKLLKSYRVESNYELPAKAIRELHHGIELQDGLVSAQVVASTTSKNVYEICLTLGRNRIIRRMFEHYGLHIKRLKRISIGPVKLDTRLKPGELRELTKSELYLLTKLTHLD